MTENIDKKDSKDGENNSETLNVLQTDVKKPLILDKNKKEIECHTSIREEYGIQRVYKKTSPNCVLTLYLPTREISLTGNSKTDLRGIVYVDPNAIQGCRIYTQLTLTFRYGREDEEVMGLRFCNEAIISLYQVWPYNDEVLSESLSPLQEALITRLGEGAHPFTLTLTSKAPPSVQLVPAKRYYGAPIGTSYDVRCFIADRTDEKFQRRASVKMGVRVIYRANVFEQAGNIAENFATFINTPCNSPPVIANDAVPSSSSPALSTQEQLTKTNDGKDCSGSKHKKSEKSDSFSKLRLSPKSFRFSGRFGRSKSEIEKYPNDPLYHYSKSFQEYEGSGNCSGPHGSVEKPFLLQDGRVSLRANLDKAWYTHGEEVRVTINVRNDSRKTVRKIRVCAIQHVDVCMFNNGKFKNVVADTDTDTDSPVFHAVPPGDTLNTTITLKPQRGQTKNWIALEDTLQRSTEPDEITGVIAASAMRSFNMIMAQPTKANFDTSETPTAVGAEQKQTDDKNVFAIYVSYYVKVKLLLSSMGGELSLKLPFVLVHINDETTTSSKFEKLTLNDIPPNSKSSNNQLPPKNILTKEQYCSEEISSMSDINIENFNKDNVKNISKQELDKIKKMSEKNEEQIEDITSSIEQIHAVQIHHHAS